MAVPVEEQGAGEHLLQIEVFQQQQQQQQRQQRQQKKRKKVQRQQREPEHRKTESREFREQMSKFVPILPRPSPAVLEEERRRRQQLQQQLQRQQQQHLKQQRLQEQLQQEEQNFVGVFVPSEDQQMPEEQLQEQLRSQSLQLQQKDTVLGRAAAAASAASAVPHQLDAIEKASDGVDIDEIRDLVATFRRARAVLGLTQGQAGVELESLSASRRLRRDDRSSSSSYSPGCALASYSQSLVCRIERLDITPRQARAVRPVLKEWLHRAKGRAAEPWR